MGKLKKVFDNLDEKLSISRRNFVKGAVAVGAGASLYGCSKDGGGDVIYGGGSSSESPDVPSINEDVFAGSSPHNCGGGCVIKAYVKDGVIKRFTTDETPEKTFSEGDFVQERACARCRSQTSWLYSSNRLMYPLIQRGERGDLSTFEKVTWEEASKYYKERADYIRSNYGEGASYQLYGTGMGGGGSPSNMLTYFGGGSVETRADYSFPSWDYTQNIVGMSQYFPRANSMQDAFSSDELVVWSYNPCESFWVKQISYYFKQIQEAGVKVTVIDQRFSQTAVAGCDEFISPMHGTDAALICGMLHAMLTDYIVDFMTLYGVAPANPAAITTAEYTAFRIAVGKYTYGFFDTLDSDGDDVNGSYLAGLTNDFKIIGKVGAGASLSAYIMGSIDTLSKAGVALNQGTSIYPDKMGYNVRSYQMPDKDGNLADDPLKGKLTKCYGQVAKTPAWASKITGIPEATIKALAKKFLTKKVTCWTGAGFQRNSEGEQDVWMWQSLIAVTKCYGEAGRSAGWRSSKGTTGAPSISRGWESAVKSADFPATSSADWTKMYDKTKITPVFSSVAGVNYGVSKQISVFTWLDAVEASNMDKITDSGATVFPSRWNLGHIKNLPQKIKFLLQMGGNILINQNGDSNHAVRVLTAKGGEAHSLNSKGYKVEFVCVLDVVMTPSARYADLVLPGSMGFERWQTQSRFWGGENMLVFSPAVSTIQGEALPEVEIGLQIAKSFGKEADYMNGVSADYNTTDKKLAFEEATWKKGFENQGLDWNYYKKGYVFKKEAKLENVPNSIVLKSYRDDPKTNPLSWTYSGRPEAYSIALMQNYEARLFNNIDSTVYEGGVGALALLGDGIKTISRVDADKNKACYVYPIPMYIPKVEGKHAAPVTDAEFGHPDPKKLEDEGFDLSFHTWHIQYRSHSTFNSSPLLNELKNYKRNSKGEASYLNRTVTNVSEATKSPLVWMDEVYETVWLNPATASEKGVEEGKPIILESKRGKIKVSPHLSQRVRKGTVMIGQGSWYNPSDTPVVDKSGVSHTGVDIGGGANTLMDLRPSRIGQGMTLANDCRVKIHLI